MHLRCDVIKTGAEHLWNVLTKIQTTVENDTKILCGIYCFRLIVQNRKKKKINKLLSLRFRANEKKLSLAGIEF